MVNWRGIEPLQLTGYPSHRCRESGQRGDSAELAKDEREKAQLLPLPFPCNNSPAVTTTEHFRYADSGKSFKGGKVDEK